MNGRSMILLIAAPILAGCARDLPLSPDFTASVARAAGREMRPLQGWCETTYQVIGGTETSITLLVEGVCQLSHLGRATTTGIQVVDFAAGTIRVDHGEYVASNGDRLFFSHDGVLGPPDDQGNPTFSGTHNFEGGTGRFLSASGSAEFIGGATPPNESGQGTGQLRMIGRLGY